MKGLSREDYIKRLRHSASHVLADAVKQLYPSAKLGIGPAIHDGFYYDFDYPDGFSEDDLARIEEQMRKIIAQAIAFESKELPKEEVRKLFSDKGETYKLELIDELGEDSVTIYKHGDFIDLCKGPHVSNTSEIKAFKLLKTAGAYWKGDQANPMLVRIYGTAFPTEEELEDYLAGLEEAKKRDHRRLGQTLELFSSMEEYGAGLILWHPMGGRVRVIIEDFWRREHIKHGYEIVFTPHIARLELWKRSGHWDFYRDSMYAPMKIDDVDYEIKPMNCPFHIQIYLSRPRSYRELPLRWAELGTVYRYEKSGVLHGLMRVRGFTQDDAHIFCRKDQLAEEIRDTLDFSLYILKTFGFQDYEIHLSTQPEKFVGSQESWDLATHCLENALKQLGYDYTVDPGEGVFYGPKIDIKIRDCLGRAWQCTTIQVDFNLPERYGIYYVGQDGEKHMPIMIHRALMGSLERFFGVLIEHYAGAFPTWLAPVQVIVASITDAQNDYAHQIASRLRKLDYRVDVDDRNEKLGFKVREAQIKKVPYVLVVGKREVERGLVSVRSRDRGELGQMELDEFVCILGNEVTIESTRGGR